MLTDSDIQSIGRRARADYDSRVGNCRAIALDVQHIADVEYGVHLDVVETQVGERRDTHYVNKLSADQYAAGASGPILIDAALDQFCSENQSHSEVRVDFGPREWLPDVAIYPPGSEERGVWYYQPNDPRDGYDVFTDTPVVE